ncbi:hypothetical protein C1H46_027460 [Malus baccata]|uniref:FBD domain-containing protein n=1 Tax=Malus baccata TaxID=106549 RepID=A0A540LKF4_MALBA|nr:hypothetical protein C1H46_027460 [Malus baccata]
MSAPNLKYLSWIGNVMNNNLNFGELLRLEKVKLSHRFGVYDLDSAFKFLYSIRRVKFLILDEATMKVLFRGLVPGPLHDVTFLRIEFEELNEDDIIPTLVSLFKAVPNLNTLHIRRKFFHYQETHSSLFSKSYWELQNLAFVSQLKQVTMDLTYESNGIELAKYMLKHARNLKKN